jgi:hypothetical protein
MCIVIDLELFGTCLIGSRMAITADTVEIS